MRTPNRATSPRPIPEMTMSFSFSRGGFLGGFSAGGRRGVSERRGRSDGDGSGDGNRNPRPAKPRSRLVAFAAAASGGAAAAGSPQGRALARRALLAGGAAAAPALLAAQSALAKKANPGKPGAQKAKIDVPKPVTNLDLNVRRLVAVGDIHGDFAQAMKALELSKCMDSEGKWIGGTTVLVQVGDILDRGDNELAIMRKFQKLAREAKEAGGDVVVMNGNHEIMNVMGDFRYVTKGAFGECRRWVEKRRAREAEKLGEENVEPLPPVPDGVTPNSYYGLWARRDLFLPGGEMAVKMASNPTVLQVGDTVFAHAGITENHVDYGFQRLNNEVAAWMVGKNSQPPKHVLEEKGVVWTRDYGGAEGGNKSEAAACKRLTEALDATGAKRLIVGHTPQQKGINSGCGGKVWRSDTGMSRGIYGNTPQVIEIVNGRVRVLSA